MTYFLKRSLLALAAGVLALALPMMAQAVPLVPGGDVDIFPGDSGEYDQTLNLAAGLHTFEFGFTPHGTPANAITTNIALASGGVTFGSFQITGPGGPFDPTILLEGNLGFIAAIQDAALQVGQPYVLTLSFSLANAASTQVNVQLSVVPLPAAGLLLIAGLGGLGLVARRRKAAVA